MAIAGKVAPTYAGEWSDILQYQQHVYVRYNGDCYISIKPSVGISPTNEEYWFLALKNVTKEQIDNIVNGTTTVGNADTLDGKHASDFLSITGGTLSGSLTVPVINIKGYNNGYSRIYKNNSDTVDYGTLFRDYDADGNSMALVLQGGNQIAATMDKDGNMYSILTENNVGSYALPINGGKITGTLWSSIDGKGQSGFSGLNNVAHIDTKNTDGTAHKQLKLFANNDISKCLSVRDFVKAIEYTVHHDGNSSKVVQATSAPSDTTAVWVDTANKVSKIYKDGAWTALA